MPLDKPSNCILKKAPWDLSKRESGWFPPELKLCPVSEGPVRSITSGEVIESIEQGLIRDNQRFQAELPSYIAAEHCTGENPLLDNIFLMVAYEQQASRRD